jgi:hypothetical protein
MVVAFCWGDYLAQRWFTAAEQGRKKLSVDVKIDRHASSKLVLLILSLFDWSHGG